MSKKFVVAAGCLVGLPLVLGSSGHETSAAEPPAASTWTFQSEIGLERDLTAAGDETQELIVRLLSPERAAASATLPVRVERDGRLVVARALHDADPDLFVRLAPPVSSGPYRLVIGEPGRPALPFEILTRRAPPSPGDAPAILEAEPNDRPEEATPFRLGTAVFASADDRPFIRSETDGSAGEGIDWYRFRLDGPGPRLLFVWLDLLDREIPVEVGLFQLEDGEPVPVGEGFERFEPEKSTRFSGRHKFVARRLESGVYHVRVAGNHPAYQLRSEHHPVPPFDPDGAGGLERAAHRAIRVAMDYTLLKGDSWHANTPRAGAVDDRARSVHAETAQCIACHPTHFTTRGALIAAENGHPIRQRAPLLFLTERLYNNPRPFYGHPQAAWARMISASANVLSRLSVILGLFEENVSAWERPGVHRDVAEYLKLYYAGREELPADESNGNRPLVSAFEVATHSWMVFDRLYRQGGDAEDRQWRDRIRTLIEAAPESHVEDVLDLCYQTIALVRIDADGYRERIARNVERIFAAQRADGQWPMGFGEEDPSAEFQTAHALYTLSLAGVPRGDPRVERGLRYLLGRQRPFGAWYDDDDPDDPHPYENFSTPFRESQFSIMALSAFFPGRGRDGWHAGFAPPPSGLDDSTPAHLIASMDGLWETPSPRVTERVVLALGNESVLVRQAAAACLGRIGGHSAVTPLIGSLEDPSKLVRRAAAWSLRQLGNRGLGRDAVLAALGADSPALRRASLQVLAQHQRYWTRDERALDVLIGERMSDPDAFVRLTTSHILWQWWQWEGDEERRGRIEDAFLERMALERDPRVFAGLKEGLYNLCDENTRYLYNNWVALLGRERDRAIAVEGHHRSSARQAARVARVLRSGTRRQVVGVLEALGSFPLRTGSYDTPGRYHRIGNDIETIQFYSEGADELRPPLLSLIGSDDPDVRRAALVAAYTLRGTGSEAALGLVYLEALGDADPQVREVARDLHDELLPPPETPQLPVTLGALLEHPDTQVKAAGLRVLGELRLPQAAAAELAPPVEQLLLSGDPLLQAQASRALRGLPALWRRGRVLGRLAAELEAEDPERRQAALQTVLGVDALASQELIARRVERALAERGDEVRGEVLRLATADADLRRSARVSAVVTEALAEGSPDLRRRALELVRRSSELQANAAVRDALRGLQGDANPRVRQLAVAIDTGETVQSEVDVAELLDFRFFAERVQPVFLTAGRDGKACVDCHHNHGILKLTSPESGGDRDAIARANYRAALRVVDLEHPERSLILVKPLSSSASEGVVDASTVSHGGALRWPKREASRHYQAVLDWITGARLVEPR